MRRESGRMGGQRRVATAVTVAVALTLGAASAAFAGTKPKPAPEEWDHRVQKYVDFVEKARGLEFDHPVPVRFLPDAKFEKALLAGDEPTEEDRQLDKQLAGELR